MAHVARIPPGFERGRDRRFERRRKLDGLTIQLVTEKRSPLARDRAVDLVSQRADWYGFDPIHIRLAQSPRAWSEILSAWRIEPEKNFSLEPSLARWLYLRSLPPQERTIFGRVRRASQPSGRLAATVALTALDQDVEIVIRQKPRSRKAGRISVVAA